MDKVKEHVPIIDIFAGPGGLGEGFSSFTDKGRKAFKIHLSIEMEAAAHRTLKLRAFFRSFPKKKPDDYFRLMRRECSLEDLYKTWPENHAIAEKEAWQATLGKTPDADVDQRIEKALNGKKEWILVGGPPCQAYSIVGRSRKGGIKADDIKVRLYEQYLRLVAKFRPTVFVMENVKGLLSATLEESIFQKILSDLKEPGIPTGITGCPGYRIHSFVHVADSVDINNDPIHKPMDFLIRSEDYGIPQARHRVILLGIRKDVEDAWPTVIGKSKKRVSCSDVISGLPRIRSSLSKEDDSYSAWTAAVHATKKDIVDFKHEFSQEIRSQLEKELAHISEPRSGLGGEFVKTEAKTDIEFADWFIDKRIGGVANHAARGHITADIRRYFFAACYSSVVGVSPKLGDFPPSLLPNHKNVSANGVGSHFEDRFRVQIEKRHASTITSHISKDGHYFIHYDPTQCRSLTVREAARIQTFPDNYFFCGNRTDQYRQVGNAVPPLLAKRLAGVVWKIMENKA